MHFSAKALYLPFSPYRLRLLADVVRGKNITYALAWLQTYKSRRAKPLQKVIASAVANAKSLKGVETGNLVIKKIRLKRFNYLINKKINFANICIQIREGT